MIYRNFKDLRLSSLGFGAMRLPVRDNGKIDENEARRMVINKR
jgi:predicted aldo/keto reductase-like oxidoreductase